MKEGEVHLVPFLKHHLFKFMMTWTATDMFLFRRGLELNYEKQTNTYKLFIESQQRPRHPL